MKPSWRIHLQHVGILKLLMLCSLRNISCVSDVEFTEEVLFPMSSHHCLNSLGKSSSTQNVCTSSAVRTIRLPKPNAVIWSFALGYFMKSCDIGRLPHLTLWWGWKKAMHLRNSTFQSWTLWGFLLEPPQACWAIGRLRCNTVSKVHEFMCQMAFWYAQHGIMDLPR